MNTTRTLAKDRNRWTASIKGRCSPDCDVAVIGAGPYGLSAAAHLRGKGLEVQIFGKPMGFWADKMPEGMLLRSPRIASNISDPRGAFTLDAYQASIGAHPAAPVPLETFVAYGRWFKDQIGASLEETPVQQVIRENGHYRLSLNNGTTLKSKRVVIAAGIGPFGRKPRVFANLPSEQASHCYEGRKFSELAGKRVAVIGAGQSALESAALLHEAGSDVDIIAKLPVLRLMGQRNAWLHSLGPVSLVFYSKHEVGPFGISRLVAMPTVVFYIPLGLRDMIRKRAMRPIGSKWLQPRLQTVRASLGRFVKTAKSVGGEVQLTLDDGSERRVDHVLMGTGFDVDISRYDFLPRDLVAQVEDRKSVV